MTKHDVSRDVVADLRVLCETGEASRDSQALVEAYLAEDADFAATLKASDKVRRVIPPVRLTPDAEHRLLQTARREARLKLLIIGGAVASVSLLALLSLLALVFLRQ